MKLIDLLIHSARRHPNRLACIYQDQQLTYRQWLSHVQTIAGQLRQSGCQKGNVVALAMNNTPEFLIAFFAASAAGASFYPLPASGTDKEWARYLAQVPQPCLLISPAHTERAGRLPIAACRSLFLMANQLATRFYKIKHTGQTQSPGEKGFCDPQLNDVALLIPTSGSTGPAKIAMLTDTALIANMLTYRRTLKITGHQKVYCTLPLHHIYPICAQLLTHISRADTLILNDRPFLIKNFFQTVKEHRISMTALVPYQGQLLAGVPDPPHEVLGSLKRVTFSGSRTPPTLYRQLTQKYPAIRFINMYGMTEAGSRIALAGPHDTHTPAASVGKPLATVQLKIIDNTNRPCPAEKIGQIIIQSPGLMKGYYHQLDLTQKTLVNGWLHTGDLGFLDCSGYLYLTGRCKNIILSGANNIYPEEIEDVLLTHPHVTQAVVVAQPHPRLQEVPHAFVVLNPLAETMNPDELIRYCRKHLSLYKVPYQITFINDCPKLPNGKINRQCLLKRLHGGFNSYVQHV